MEHDKKNLADQDASDQSAAASNKDDLTDSPHDAERLTSDQATLDLPEVSDIPGQEHISVPRMGEFTDTTASSDDEEGDELLGE